jgi:hypothetical protein
LAFRYEIKHRPALPGIATAARKWAARGDAVSFPHGTTYSKEKDEGHLLESAPTSYCSLTWNLR